jgi:2-octaprenyl-6-methoxyphenol hydroxylase
VSEHNEDFDVVIIGGGLVGLSLALALKPHVRVAIIEKETDREITLFKDGALNAPGARAIALSRASVHIFERLAIWSELLTGATPIKKIHVSERYRFGKTRFNCTDYQMTEFGYVIDSLFLIAILKKTVHQLAHIQFFYETELKTITPLNHGQQLDVVQNNTSRQLTTQLLIAADGTHSSLRERLGFVTQHKDYQQTAVVTHVDLSHPHHFVATERFVEKGAIALLPVGEQQGTLIWTLNNTEAKRVATLSDHDFLQEAQTYFGYSSGQLMGCGQRSLYPLQALNVAQPYTAGVLLLGNAAHTLHPIAAQGFNLALRDVYDLSKRVNRAELEAVDMTQRDFLKEYHDARHADQALILNMTDGLLSLFKLPFSFMRSVRSTGMVLMDCMPMAKSWLARRLMGLSG